MKDCEQRGGSRPKKPSAAPNFALTRVFAPLTARSDAPCDHGLGDLSLLDELADLVLLDSTDLAQNDENLDVGVGLVAEQVVHEGRALEGARQQRAKQSDHE